MSTAAIMGVCLFPMSAFADTSGAISQSFTAASSDITAGTIVSVVPNNTSAVEPANSLTAAKGIEGIAANKPLMELSTPQHDNVQVVVRGTTSAYVSDINGSVNVGDHIVASPISGVGMKAITPSEIVGTAQAPLSSVQTITQTLTTKTGKQVTVHVGLIPIAVNVTYYGASAPVDNIGQYIPPFLQGIANNINHGKSVSPLRVLISTIGVVLGVLTAIIIAYTSLRNSATSAGRNPLAKSALRGGLMDALIVSIGTIIFVVVLAYFVLTK